MWPGSNPGSRLSGLVRVSRWEGCCNVDWSRPRARSLVARADAADVVRRCGVLRVCRACIHARSSLDTHLRLDDRSRAGSAADDLRRDRDRSDCVYTSKQHCADASAHRATGSATVAVRAAWTMTDPGARSEDPLIARLFTKLADGQFHSGEALAADLAVSRSAVWKAARALRGLGATVHAVRNRGYRLPEAAEPLNAARISGLLSEVARKRVRQVDTAWTVGSTNTVLMERAHPPVGTSE